jgi:rare lipoprotein A
LFSEHGQHAARHQASPETPRRRRPNIIAATAGAIVAAVLVGGAIASLHLGPSKPTASDAAPPGPARTTQERADRGELREAPAQAPSPSDSPSPSGAPSPTLSPTPGPTVAPTTAKPKASPTKTKTQAPESGTVTSSGTCNMSFYDDGDTTASGEPFDPNGLTAANKTLPFNTKVKITNLANNKSVTVRINDRGPFVAGRCFDLAKGAFTQVASTGAGVINARYEVLK